MGGRLEGSVLWWTDINTEGGLYTRHAGDADGEGGCRWSRSVVLLRPALRVVSERTSHGMNGGDPDDMGRRSKIGR